MSLVWKYFSKDENDKTIAKCKHCPKVLKCCGSSTSSLSYHLRKVHSSKLDEDEIPTTSNIAKKVCGPMEKYFKSSSVYKLEEIIARSVAEDGMSVRSFKKSKVILSLLNVKGLKMPSSERTIWKYFSDFYFSKKDELIADIKKVLENKGRFSIIVDEWSDISYLKYINVTLRYYDPTASSFKIYSLGLEELRQKGTASNITDTIENKLQEFGINFDKHIVCSTHDGAAVMKKYGKSISAESQLCINHAIHLSVVDTLYAKKVEVLYQNEREEDCEFEDSDFEIESDDDDGHYREFEIKTEFEIKAEIYIIINRVRKCCKLFNKSNEKHQKLQAYVKMQEGKELRLIHDIKHRWSSLFKMVDNFLRIYKCVNHVLADFDLDLFTSSDIQVLENLSKTLKPLDVAIKELSKDSATLIEFEGIIKFLINNLIKANNTIANDLIKNLRIRFNERRIQVLNTLILYLHSGIFPSSNTFLKYSTKTETKEFGNKLFCRMFGAELCQDESDDDPSTEETIDGNTNNLLTELTETIRSVKNVKKLKQDSNGIMEDFICLDKSRKRNEKLDNLYYGLLSISPTSTISERVFSKSSFIKNKEKNRLTPNHLNQILFLKDYFLRSP